MLANLGPRLLPPQVKRQEFLQGGGKLLCPRREPLEGAVWAKSAFEGVNESGRINSGPEERGRGKEERKSSCPAFLRRGRACIK